VNAPEHVQENLVQYMPFASLRPSPTNTRQVLEHLNELADSIARVGILQPIIVRPHPTEAEAWEIVSGHRRFAAAALAAEQTGQPTPDLPVRLVNLNDEQVCEVQIVENLQRDDLAPMDEANGYLRLVTEFKQTVDEIAERVGKSRAYVYAKLKLCALNESARRALQAGQITESIAVLVARIPEPLQDKAVKAVTEEDYRRDAKTESMSFRQAANLLREKFTTDLRKAKWSLDDQTLVDGTSACNMCPKKAGNSPDEYPDIKDERTCMDPTCFAVKRAAHERQLEVLALEKADVKLKAGAARDAIDSYTGNIRPDSGLVKLTDKPQGSTKTWNQLAKSAGIEVETIAVIDKERSKVHVVAKGDQLAKALREAGVKVKAPKVPDRSTRVEPDNEKFRAEAAAMTARNAAAVKAIWENGPVVQATLEARALFELTLSQVNEFRARKGLSLIVEQAPAAEDEDDGNDDQGPRALLRSVALPDGDGDDCQRYMRGAILLLLASRIEVDTWALAMRRDEVAGPLSPTGIAKLLGITVDTPPDPTVAAQAGDQTAEPATPAKDKRTRKTKGTAVPATEATPKEVGSADVENEEQRA
jgi:ParB/RepB/Spo0J family partition protein